MCSLQSIVFGHQRVANACMDILDMIWCILAGWGAGVKRRMRTGEDRVNVLNHMNGLPYMLADVRYSWHKATR